MRLTDYWQYSLPVFNRHKSRTVLLTLAIAIGVCSVILLTSIGEGARRFIQQEFSSLGTELLIILPGKKETQGGAPPIYGTTPRDLTLEDMQAISHINTIKKIAPIIAGTALIGYQNRSREVITMGSTPDLFDVRDLKLGDGKMLPNTAYHSHTPVIILGAKLKRELFGRKSPIGEWVRAGEYRFRVIGTLEERGESMGLDLRDMAIIPVRSAEMLFNSPALFRVLIQLSHADSEDYTRERIRKIIAKRHEGEDDISFVSQDSLLNAFNAIITTVTAVVGAIAAISLVVAGVLIMNVTFISVAQRRQEIGLLKALGATSRQVKHVFIGEAVLLTAGGTLLGLLVAYGLIHFAAWYWPDFPIAAAWWAIVSAIVIAFTMGILFSWLPASKAAQLDPILALRGFQ